MNLFQKTTVQKIDTQKRQQAEHNAKNTPGALLPTLIAWSAGMVAGASAVTHLGQASLNKMAANGQLADIESKISSSNLEQKFRSSTENMGKDLKRATMENGDDVLRVVEELEENKEERKRKEELAAAKKIKESQKGG